MTHFLFIRKFNTIISSNEYSHLCYRNTASWSCLVLFHSNSPFLCLYWSYQLSFILEKTFWLKWIKRQNTAWMQSPELCTIILPLITKRFLKTLCKLVLKIQLWLFSERWWNMLEKTRDCKNAGSTPQNLSASTAGLVISLSVKFAVWTKFIHFMNGEPFPDSRWTGKMSLKRTRAFRKGTSVR